MKNLVKVHVASTRNSGHLQVFN